MKKDKPIIGSRLDLDYYKCTMGRWIYDLYPDIPVTFSMINRSKTERLVECIDREQLKEELDHVQTLTASHSEIAYLKGLGFNSQYVDFFANMQLPDYELGFNNQINDIDVKFPGPWITSTYWETYALAIINELRVRHHMRHMSDLDQRAYHASGLIRLKEKKDVLSKCPLEYTEFGTRRRESFDWQLQANHLMRNELPYHHVSTSNIKIAMMIGLKPSGTNAHECQQVIAALAGDNDEKLKASVDKFLREWLLVYKSKESVILSDTYGTDFILKHGDPELIAKFKGFRHDSGDPFEFARKIIKWYLEHDIDSREKLIIFSDSLNVELMVNLRTEFHRKINVTFGWGTNFTFDFDYIRPISLVCKVTEVAGCPAVKLSDNLAKAVGPPEEVARYKRVFGYTRTFTEECRT